MIDGGTAEKCPNLRIAFSHGGGTFPFLLPRYNHQWSGTWNEEAPGPGRGAAAAGACRARRPSTRGASTTTRCSSTGGRCAI